MAFSSTKSFEKAASTAGLSPPLNVRAIASKYSLSSPISVIDLMGKLAPQQRIWGSAFLKAGDVEGNGFVAVQSDGKFSIKADLSDQGQLYGDNFTLTATSNGGNFSAYIKAHLDGGGAEFHNHADGQDQSIEKVWPNIRDHSVHWELDSTQAVGGDEWAGVIAEVAGVAGLIIAAVVGGHSANWSQDSQGNTTVTFGSGSGSDTHE